MKIEDIDFYEKVHSQISELLKEVGILSKSKPDNPINTFKLKFINEKLKEANTLLVGVHKPFADFETFDETSLPSNSDVVLVLSQYADCLEGWRSAHVTLIFGTGWCWNIEGSKHLRTDAPSRFRREEAI